MPVGRESETLHTGAGAGLVSAVACAELPRAEHAVVFKGSACFSAESREHALVLGEEDAACLAHQYRILAIYLSS